MIRVLLLVFLLLPLNLGSCKEIQKAPVEQQLIDQGLVDIHSVSPDILVHLAYSTTNNFLHKDVYGDLTRCYLQPVVARMLASAQKKLIEKQPGYHLIVYDGVRPRSVQWKMWDIVKGTDGEGYVANPATGSIHNYGCAVDLSITDAQGYPLDMGTPFDFFGPEAQPRYEEKYLQSGRLTQMQLSNRLLLRNIMLEAGFQMIRNEWWHFNAFSNQEVKSRFKIIE